MIGCPIRCTYCPQDALTSAYPKGATRMMSLSDFCKIALKLPSKVRIDFSGMSEPWANPLCTAMLVSALSLGFQVAIYTTLQGLHDSDVDVVLRTLRAHQSQVEIVCLHLPDATGNMRGFKRGATYDRALSAFREYGKTHPRFEEMTMHEEGEQLLSALRLLPFDGHDRAGSLDRAQVGAQPVRAPARNAGAIRCSYTPVYDHNVLLPNGDVYLCCMDYGLKVKLGNLLKQSYASLFDSPEMARLRERNAGDGETICRSCHGAEAQ